MTVKIKIPSAKGHDTLMLSVSDAEAKLGEFAQNQWLVAINGKLSSTQTKLKDGDDVIVAKAIWGG